MKKLLMVVSIICLLFLIAVDTPPALPSSFYGNVSGAKVGQVVIVLVTSKVVASSQVFLYNGQMVYSVDVPMGIVGSPVKEGAIATFKVNGVFCEVASLHSGTLARLNLFVRSMFRRN